MGILKGSVSILPFFSCPLKSKFFSSDGLNLPHQAISLALRPVRKIKAAATIAQLSEDNMDSAFLIKGDGSKGNLLFILVTVDSITGWLRLSHSFLVGFSVSTTKCRFISSPLTFCQISFLANSSPSDGGKARSSAGMYSELIKVPADEAR